MAKLLMFSATELKRRLLHKQDVDLDQGASEQFQGEVRHEQTSVQIAFTLDGKMAAYTEAIEFTDDGEDVHDVRRGVADQVVVGVMQEGGEIMDGKGRLVAENLSAEVEAIAGALQYYVHKMVVQPSDRVVSERLTARVA